MTTTDHGLLQVILDNPADDCARFVYSDWLEEQGQSERAKFIRAQCQLAAWDCTDIGGFGTGSSWQHKCRAKRRGPFPCHELRRREIALLEVMPDGIWFPQEPLGGLRKINCVYRRGFLGETVCTLADWLHYGPVIVRQQPIERVAITDMRPHQGLADWFWWGSPGGEIPDELAALLVSIYRSRADALADLSRACLRWAREQAS